MSLVGDIVGGAAAGASAALGALLGTVTGEFTQAHRLLRLHTPLGPDALFAEDLVVWEAVAPLDGPALGDVANGLPASLDASLGPVRAGLRLVVHALSGDAHLELKTLIGQPALVELLCQDSATQRRPWHGHVVAAALTGSDGGLARYRLVIEPWLSAASQRVDARVFQDATVPQILDAVFVEYSSAGRLDPAWRWELADPSVYPRRSLCIQYHESDLDFVLRLMREEGLFFWWEHEGSDARDGSGRHTLVIADHNDAFVVAVQPVVRFTGSDHTLGADSLTLWASQARTVASRVAMRSRDHRTLAARPVAAAVAAAGTPALPLPSLDIDDTPGVYAYEDITQGERLVARQAEALAAQRARVLARGPWRRAQAGTTFLLTDHPRHDGSDPTRDTFAVIATEHRARNDFSAHERAAFDGLSSALQAGRTGWDGLGPVATAAFTGRGHDVDDEAVDTEDDEPPLHEAALWVQPATVPMRAGATDPSIPLPPQPRQGILGPRPTLDPGSGPDLTPRVAPPAFPSLFDPHAVATLQVPDVRLNLRPTIQGTQTALVVGDARDEIHTDRDNRVRLQFHWQRGSDSSHRLDPATNRDDAPATAAAFTWVRVGQSQAGVNHGAVFIPRVGHEVLVAFTGGDIDRPVVVGAVYNGQGQADDAGNQVPGGAAASIGSAPPWFPGETPSGDGVGHDHPAVLLGHRSRELGARDAPSAGYGQLVFDDSPDGARIELSTTTSDSRLQLGALREQADNRLLAPRGHGLELATSGHAALRAGAGLLVSAHGTRASVDGGWQLEADVPAQVLQSAAALVHAETQAAQASNAKLADEPAVAAPAPDDTAHRLPVERALAALAASLAGTASLGVADDGAGDDAIDGEAGDDDDDVAQGASTDGADAGADDDGDASSDAAWVAIDGGLGTVPAWTRPDLVLAAPAGIGLFTPASTAVIAGGSAVLSAGQDAHLVAQRHQTLAVAKGLILHTAGVATDPDKPNTETGLLLHAAAGTVHAASLQGAADLTASGAVDLTSTQADVLIAGAGHVLLAAAGAALRIEPSAITLTAPGAVSFKAAMKNLTSAASDPAASLSLPRSDLALPQEQPRFSLQVDLADLVGLMPGTTQAVESIPWEIRRVDGTVLGRGMTDGSGDTARVFTHQAEDVYVYLHDGACSLSMDALHDAGETRDDAPVADRER